jgi:hypothetical protein
MAGSQRRESAAAYLRGLQRTYGDLTSLRWEFSKDEIDFERLLDDEEFVRKLKAVHGERSREQLRAILEGPLVEPDKTHFVARSILSGLPDAEAGRLRTIPIGALPTNDPNAAAIRTPGGDPVVVVNTGMMALLSRSVNAFIGVQPTPLTPAMWSDRKATNWIVQGCIALATGTARAGMDRVPTFTDPMRMTASASLVDCATAFIIGHEYGHVQLGHLEDGDVCLKRLLSSDLAPSLEVYHKRHEQEFDADRRGAELAVVFNRQTHRPPSQAVFFAMSFFFQLVQVLDICTGSTLDRTSHPPAADRWQSVKSIVRSQYDDMMERDLAQLDAFFDGVRAGAAE